MREYLFRGKRIDNGEWVEGCLWVFDDYADISYRDQEYSEIVNTVEVIPETVGQYTGLRDCKRTAEYPEGQMIFEGDIVTIPDSKKLGLPAPIHYDCERATFEVSRSGYNPLSLVDAREFYDVIGNIHDNRELLKEGGEE